MGYQALDTKLTRETILRTANLAPKLSERDRTAIGAEAREGYLADINSRKDWETRYQKAMRLALQVVKKRSFPWENCSNVAFPLITVAALQYAAKAYPALISGRELFIGQVHGEDRDGKLTQAAERIGAHMTWQALKQDPAWEEETDKLLLAQAICGCAFRKTWFAPDKRRLASRLVLPADLVLNYYTRSLEDATRYTHRFYLSRNGIEQRIRLGLYTRQDIDAPSQYQQDSDEITDAEDDRQGIEKPPVDAVTPYFMGEQYCWWDLDGDGFDEPYVVTIDLNTQKLWRIAARFLPSGVEEVGGEVIGIHPVPVFTKYPFIPAPDGGFYDLGLGSLLGPINGSVNDAINQLFDAGTMATLGGGFVGRGFKSKGGPFTFRPHLWVPTDAPGDDLRKNILPLPVREPSDVLFKLLGFLVQYAERIVSATDIQVGESPGQNMKAGTADILNTNGQRVYSSIYKRDWRSIAHEGEVRAMNNRFFLDQDVDFNDLTTGRGAMITPADYQLSKVHVTPAADPHIVSDQERKMQAMMLLENAYKYPNHNRYQATIRAYKAMAVPNIDQIVPPPKDKDGKDLPDFPPAPNVKMMEVQIKEKDQQLKEKRFHVEQMEIVSNVRMDVDRNEAEIIKLYAQAQKFAAEAGGVDTGHQIELIKVKISALKDHNTSLLKYIELVQKSMEKSNAATASGGQDSGDGGAVSGAGMAGMGKAPGNGALLPAPA